MSSLREEDALESVVIVIDFGAINVFIERFTFSQDFFIRSGKFIIANLRLAYYTIFILPLFKI